MSNGQDALSRTPGSTSGDAGCTSGSDPSSSSGYMAKYFLLKAKNLEMVVDEYVSTLFVVRFFPGMAVKCL